MDSVYGGVLSISGKYLNIHISPQEYEKDAYKNAISHIDFNMLILFSNYK